MNELNYASLEASKKLYDTGIVLDTEYFWRVWDGFTLAGDADNGHELVNEETKKSLQDPDSSPCDNERYNIEYIPAPSMAEVWRELPEEYINKNNTLFHLTVEKQRGCSAVNYISRRGVFAVINNPMSINPADALIELLIWLKKQNRERIVKKLIDHADKLKW